MCGIVGHLSVSCDINSSWVDLGRAVLQHRGPDGGSTWKSQDGHAVFGHQRLSIVDLTSAGEQPMRRGSLCVTFNGEIYNYFELKRQLEAKGLQFQSNCDTEIVLVAFEAWGPAGLDRLEGMFSFSLYDSKNKLAYLMRDRVGEKPLFYRHHGLSIRFASELKALLVDSALPRKLNAEALNYFLEIGFVPGDKCILEGFSKLPPAHRLCFDLQTGELSIHRYWTEPLLSHEVSENIDDLTNDLELLLSKSVAKQLVADVPVGVMLSGGVDSSIITALASQLSPCVKTFTVGFPGANSFDETFHARKISKFFSTDHTEIQAQDASVELLPLLARQFDEPIMDSSMIPTFLVSQVMRQHCKAVLGGDGADELFGGYSHYNRLLKLQKAAALVPFIFRRLVRSATYRFAPVGLRGRNWLTSLGLDLERELPVIATYYDYHQRICLLHDQSYISRLSQFSSLFNSESVDDLLQRAMRFDFSTYLPEDILVKVDRASMLNSIEVRAPFLDPKVVEFAFSHVPSSFKCTNGFRKILLKNLARKILPPDFDFQRKQGFSIPMERWLMSDQWSNFFRSTLLEMKNPLFNPQYIKKLLSAQAQGAKNGERLFGLVMFELWRSAYHVYF